MKKILAILLTLSVVLALAACGASKGPQSVEDLSKSGNFALIQPQNVNLTDETFATPRTDGLTIYEYAFTVDGVPCKLRYADTSIETDISGVNAEGGYFTDTENEDYYKEDDERKAQRWVTVDGQYIFLAEDKGAWEWTQFDAICSQFRKMEPVRWSAPVPFKTYQAMEGSYMDEAQNMAAIKIKGDHVLLMVYTTLEDGSRKSWEMEATLQDDRLTYEKETIETILYDEEAGETTETPLPDGGAGTVQVQGDTLIFSGASSEELQGLTLTKMG